ncbi:hypothetical protein ABKN59_010175 [Abortiporus biennis]
MAKKSIIPDHQQQQIVSMSYPSSHTVDAVPNGGLNSISDEDDDICPVCESECTCTNRDNASGSQFPSTSTQTAPTTTGSHPLKIKFTLPSHLKFRRDAHVVLTDNSPHLLPSPAIRTPSAIIQQTASDMTQVPKKRGRPSKAMVAAREAARLAGLNISSTPVAFKSPYPSAQQPSAGPPKLSNRSSSSRTNVRPMTTTRRTNSMPVTRVPSRPHSAYLEDISDSDHSLPFPTFVSAASSSHCSSSESSDSELSSIESESGYYPGHRSKRLKQLQRDQCNEDVFRKRHESDQSNSWEIKSRMRSVGPETVDADEEASTDDAGADDEDEEDEEDDDDGDDDEDAEATQVEADIEEDGLLDEEDGEDTAAPTHDGKLGVSFGGVATGWSEDEESSFDADLFFANLDDDSSDSDVMPAALEHGAFASDVESDHQVNFSADEDDALLLMDVDPSAHIRRGGRELEFSVAIDGLFGGWNDQLDFLPGAFHDSQQLSSQETEDDVDMESDGGSSTENPWISHLSHTVQLAESDGETTEDELVDANGLPNSRAMMLFRWPTIPVDDVEPHPTTKLETPLTPPANATHSTRIALASLSAQLVDGSGKEIASPFPKMIRSSVEMSSLPQIVTETEQSEQGDEDSKVSSLEIPVPSDSIPATSEDTAAFSHASESEDVMTDVIGLDDVLESTFLNLESPPVFDFVNDDDTEPSPDKTPMSHLQSLSRWDRIPVSTFRRTRETLALESPVGNNKHYAGTGTLGSHAILCDSKQTKSKRSSKRSKNKASSNAPVALERDPFFSPATSPTQPAHSQNNKQSRRDLRRDRAAKRQMMGKVSPRRPQQQRNYHHHNYPNMKSRGSSSMQRTNSSFGATSSSMPM